MKTAVFKISEMIAELEKTLSSMEQAGTASNGLSAEPDVIGKVQAKLAALQDYKDLTITARKYSARQKNILEQTLMNPQAGNRGMKVSPDIPAFKKKAIQFGVIGMEPRILEMTKISEKTESTPEIWQITDAALDSDEFGWELQEILIEMLDEVNPKNWN